MSLTVTRLSGFTRRCRSKLRYLRTLVDRSTEKTGDMFERCSKGSVKKGAVGSYFDLLRVLI